MLEDYRFRIAHRRSSTNLSLLHCSSSLLAPHHPARAVRGWGFLIAFSSLLFLSSFAPARACRCRQRLNHCFFFIAFSLFHHSAAMSLAGGHQPALLLFALSRPRPVLALLSSTFVCPQRAKRCCVSSFLFISLYFIILQKQGRRRRPHLPPCK